MSSRPYTPSPLVLRVDTNLVETGVVVRDRNGHAIAGLTQADFKIFDDGKEREITAFSMETSTGAGILVDAPSGRPAASPATAQPPQPPSARSVAAPRFVALLFDDVHTRQSDLSHTQVAAERFVREAFEPGDHVAIFTTSRTRVLAFTTDTAK